VERALPMFDVRSFERVRDQLGLEGAFQPTEIERKWVVTVLPSLEGLACREIVQGYLETNEPGVEVRLRNDGEGFFRTEKRGAGMERTEVEVPITRAEFDTLWPFTEGRRVEKTRYLIPFEDFVVELDVYGGRLSGLVVAEVEFRTSRDATVFSPPEWFGPEVTDDKRYKNHSWATTNPQRLASFLRMTAGREEQGESLGGVPGGS